ncbi:MULTISPECIES: gamma-glutamyl-gamma-aminobutyrate hydrolase family protein [Ramlibacter]|uniref:gamma-glutamyl-gamma-aminobutyrate hydrolase n=1 Tax=Ramlibacter pinisoli TaxID=2682844 RepID=A0A6N8IYE1_9BURK|nr:MULTISPECIES: gamma-glutamyl-gamma-aminobutyrate hydrolase family protein [Ramlibacter]MBA2961031.1 gamma-glutamyl-gamma-aminobutyrate hydrolase family protein [Ramlibacter sp. CGMCC 1.13660]MVQ30976.1 gamma-glutamyl-gamma-aminobutyrate hydrolase family protein [Ramlibacter pinisoli]
MPRPFAAPRAVVAISTDRVEREGHATHAGFHGYVHAVSAVAGALPLLLPSDAQALDADTLIASVDGVLLTGSPSNVDPARYDAPRPHAAMTLDPARDAAILPLLARLVEAGVPLLAVCRGFQELNVAFGGTLHPAVHTLPGRLDHREGDHDRPVERWYDDSHALRIVPGGRLAQLAGCEAVQVNSLHHQGIDRLGAGLRIEAVAPDGLVEAFSVADAPGFTLAVQWHPEMRVDDSPLARALFSGFGQACLARRDERLRSLSNRTS